MASDDISRLTDMVRTLLTDKEESRNEMASIKDCISSGFNALNEFKSNITSETETIKMSIEKINDRSDVLEKKMQNIEDKLNTQELRFKDEAGSSLLRHHQPDDVRKVQVDWKRHACTEEKLYPSDTTKYNIEEQVSPTPVMAFSIAPPPYQPHDVGNAQLDTTRICCTRERFYIVSQLNTNRVLEVKDSKMESETAVLSGKMKANQLNQLWYKDDDGVIHSALNRYVMDVKKDFFGRELIVTRPYSGSSGQKWRFLENKLMNDLKFCIEIYSGSTSNGASVISCAYNGLSKQHWGIQIQEPEMKLYL